MNHEFYDNTKLALEKTCPRKYYFRIIRKWRTEGISPPLIFGLSWHAAMDAVWRFAKEYQPKDLVNLGMVAFEEEWKNEGGLPIEDMPLDQFEKWNPRVPPVAHEMLIHYIQQRGPVLRSCELISSEQPFVVPLFPAVTQSDGVNIWYAGRKDKRFIYNGQRIVGEHKTTTDYKKDGGFKANYVEGWYMSSQVFGYLYSDNILSGGKTDYVWVDAALVHKTVHNAFRFIPVQHKYGQLDQWLWDTRKRVERIREETKVLQDLRSEGQAKKLKFMPVFSRNEESCVNVYGKCPYFNLCTQFPNPEQQEEVPEGMIEEEWSPVDVLGLDRLIKDGEVKVEDEGAKV